MRHDDFKRKESNSDIRGAHTPQMIYKEQVMKRIALLELKLWTIREEEELLQKHWDVKQNNRIFIGYVWYIGRLYNPDQMGLITSLHVVKII